MFVFIVSQGYKGIKGVRGRGGDTGPVVRARAPTADISEAAGACFNLDLYCCRVTPGLKVKTERRASLGPR